MPNIDQSNINHQNKIKLQHKNILFQWKSKLLLFSLSIFYSVKDQMDWAHLSQLMKLSFNKIITTLNIYVYTRITKQSQHIKHCCLVVLLLLIPHFLYNFYIFLYICLTCFHFEYA